MAGIMPAGGVPPLSAQNALNDAPLKDGCDSLWNANRCTPRFDPASANAVISEILNVIGAAGLEYDCTLLDNLAKAVSIHEISGNGSAALDGGSAPISIPNGTNKKLGSGSITIPNTFHRNIRVMLYADITVQWAGDNDIDNTSSLDVDTRFDIVPPDIGATQPNLTYRVRGDDGLVVSNSTFVRIYDVPPGGRPIYWDVRASTSGPGNWTLPYTGNALSFRVFGTSTHTRDIFTTA